MTAASICHPAPVEIFHPVAVKPGAENALAFVHVTINRIPWLETVIGNRRGHLDFRWLKRNVNAGDRRDRFPLGYYGNGLAIFFPRREQLDVVTGCPCTELTALERTGFLVNFLRRERRIELGRCH